MNRLRIVRAVQTCAGCPSQWDAWTEDGTYLYLRFRWGVGTAAHERGSTFGDAPVARFETGDPWDGIISLADFCARAGLALAPDAEAY